MSELRLMAQLKIPSDTLEDAKLMTIEYNGHYELEFASNSIFN